MGKRVRLGCIGAIMPLTAKFCIVAIYVLAILPSAPLAFGAVSVEERQKAFAWFDALGYPPIAKFPLIKVYDGGWMQIEDQRRQPTYKYGFLAESDKQHFTVVPFTLWTEKLTISPATAQNERVYFEPVDLPSYARGLIKTRTSTGGYVYPDPMELKWPVTFFLLARACEARGESDLAAKLCDMADKDMDRPEPNRPALPFHDRIANELSYFEIWRLVLDFGDPKVSRETLLRRSETFPLHFPDSRYRILAQDMTVELRRMVREDKEHNTLPFQEGTNFQERRIADLVFALRDQNGRQWGQPGACDVFADPRWEQSPASQLVKIGLPAVPALLGALTDSRLTRSVGFWRDYCFSHRILRVGDAALVVLETIARRGFESNVYWNRYPRWDERTTAWGEQAIAIQVAARKWWSEVQARGEAALLAEAVQRGDDTSAWAAERLVALYPDVALPALAKGIDRASTDENRQALVKVAGSLQRPTVLPLLIKQMRQGRGIRTRIQAAFAVNKRGDPSAISYVEDEWKHLKSEDRVPEELCQFLIECGAPEAIRIMGDGLLARKLDYRFFVITTVLSDYDPRVLANQPPKRSTWEVSSNLSARSGAMQTLLASLLRDKSVWKGLCGFRETSFRNPRICDVANFALARFWPNRYSFHESPSLFERDRECLLMLNRWRTANGLRSLPLPTRPAITREKRLSRIVREVQVESMGLTLGTGVRRRLTQLRGCPFTATVCSDLVTYLMTHLPRHASGLRLYAYRDNDGSGFLIRASFLQAKNISRTSFRQSDAVTAGSVSLLDSSGEATYESEEGKAFDMKEVKKAIHNALSSRPDTPVSITIEREFESETMAGS